MCPLCFNMEISNRKRKKGLKIRNCPVFAVFQFDFNLTDPIEKPALQAGQSATFSHKPRRKI